MKGWLMANGRRQWLVVPDDFCQGHEPLTISHEPFSGSLPFDEDDFRRAIPANRQERPS